MSDVKELVTVLTEIGIPHDVSTSGTSGEYTDVTIKGTASDHEFTVVFKDNKYEYTQ